MGQLLLQQADDLNFRKVSAVAHVWRVEDGEMKARPGGGPAAASDLTLGPTASVLATYPQHREAR